jgi:protein MpaA
MIFTELRTGTTVEKCTIHSYKSEIKSDKYIYLMAGVHGDEVEGVYVLQNLFNYLKDDENLHLQLPLIIIPNVNIDGYRAGTRTNAHGVDLNRNMPSETWSPDFTDPGNNPGSEAASEPETQYLLKLFEKYPPKLIISMHSWKPVLNYNGETCKAIAEFLEQHNQYPIVEGDIEDPTPGSLGMYAPEKYDCPILTFEFPELKSGKTLKEIWKDNKDGLIGLLKSSLLQNFK